MSDFKCADCQLGLCARGCGRQDKQLNTYDWLADVPNNERLCDFVEVQFKNTRKDYYVNSNNLPLKKGDMVAVEAMPGHDVGVVTLTGALVRLQMAKLNLKPEALQRRVYRIAREADLVRCEEAKALEHGTMIKSRQIAKDLGLDMKIGDVEYQGDGSKAIFYYIADQRVDFRQLIKVLAEEFHVRIEMRQIGARQEAGRIGGIGPCGREMCCATWMKNFSTVSTSAARCQSVSLNPQKLAGQCAKLKCCLNYEVSTYLDAAARMPSKDVRLETADKVYVQVKTDVLAGLACYATDKHTMEDAVTISAERAREVIEMNQRGQKPDTLQAEGAEVTRNVVVDLAGQDSLTRFDKSKKNKHKNRNRSGHRQGGTQENRRAGRPDRDTPRGQAASAQANG